MRPFLIGIAGPSGSGKTYLAKRLALTQPSAFSFLSLDNYYLPLDHLSPAERDAVNFDHPDAIDWPLAARHLEMLANGHPVQAPGYRFDLHTRGPAGEPIQPREHLLVEGILALHEESVRRQLHLKIYVETPGGECFRRRLDRDCRERGRTPESVERQFRATVDPMARQFVLPSRQWADLIVSGDAVVEQSVRSISAAIQKRRNKPAGY
ncbi:MAG: uridine kinase [Bryobacteraceae bacterium]